MTEPTWTGIGPRERRWLLTFLILGSAYFGVLLIQILIGFLGGFSQILLILFLAWLLAFVMSPVVRFFGEDYLQIQDGERTARTGCVETKELLAERIIERFRPMRARRQELASDPEHVERVLAAGAAKVRPILEATMAEVHAATGIGLPVRVPS